MKAAQHISDLRQMEVSDLDARLKEVRTELFNLRFQAATGQLENHRQIRQVRHQIAQVLTVIQGRMLGLEEKVAQAPDSAVAPQTKPKRGRGRGAAADVEPAVDESATVAESDAPEAAAEAEVTEAVDQAPDEGPEEKSK
jgi:large subunit ribosomal protein L29